MKNEDKLTWKIVAVLLSILLPGLGQVLIQKRYATGIAFFLACLILWFAWLGWIIHIWAICDAALHEDEDDAPNGPAAAA